MSFFRTLLCAGALCLTVAGTASAQGADTNRHIPLAGLLQSQSIRQAGVDDPTNNLAIRGGLMVSPRGAGLAGVDFTLPTLSLGAGWIGRVDADVIFKANFGGVNTAIFATVDQIYYTPGGGTTPIYWGGGVGAIFGGGTSLAGKLILGADFASKISGEVNLGFAESDTIITVVGRLRL
jgi:ethanolamine utilization microcompartment shell protein EutS